MYFVYVLLNDKECDNLVNNLESLFIYLNTKNKNIGKIKIDISLLNCFKTIKGYYNIKDYNNKNFIIGQVFVNIHHNFKNNNLSKRAVDQFQNNLL